MPKGYSGKQLVRILELRFGFVAVRQNGSHLIMKGVRGGKMMVTVIPLHKELAHGTFRGVLRLAGIEYDEFKSNV
jgi:predicted RNA binding protein YcfA (HicA-like mRNA interferase family)